MISGKKQRLPHRPEMMSLTVKVSFTSIRPASPTETLNIPANVMLEEDAW
jgi:hypothetical protein